MCPDLKYYCSSSTNTSCQIQIEGLCVSPQASNNLDRVIKGGYCHTSDDKAIIQTCGKTEDTPFINFDKIKKSTADASPACLGMLGPDITVEAHNTDQGTCGLMLSTTNNGHGKWMDLACNQKTRTLMCTVLGKQYCN